MPELVKRSVESPPGTSDIEGTAVCPCSTKKSMKVWRISLPVIFLVIRTPIELVSRLYQVLKLRIDVILLRTRLAENEVLLKKKPEPGGVRDLNDKFPSR